MPERIGRYRVERVLGSGAFATVWLGVDETLDARVAIKVLAENWLHDDDIRRRFTQEARILWRLDSERIVRVHTVDQLEDGRPYFVMDYADGGSLADRMNERAATGRRWSVDEAVALSVAIADGLAVAHAQGIVHRDLKPSNILFKSGSAGERMVLADFGIARSLEAATRSTIAAGTPHYMAPEQTEGHAERGSDVYAAAVVLYELLAGQVPFPYPSAGQVLRAQFTQEAPDIRGTRPDVPAFLAAVLARGLLADPARRYAGAQAWRDSLAGARPDAASTAAGYPTVPPIDEGVPPTELAGFGSAGAVPSPPPAPSLPPRRGEPPLPPRPGEPPSGRRRPAGPPPPPPGWVGGVAAGGGGGAQGGDPRRRSRRRLLLGLGLVVLLAGAGTGIALVAGGGHASASEIYRDSATSNGLAPFTPSLVPQTVSRPSGPAPKVPKLTLPPVPAGVTPRLAGATPGLYGGTEKLSVCDAKALVSFLNNNPDKAAAWAQAQNIRVDQIGAYVGSLTDVVLRSDTRVTNHGFTNGQANGFQSVLEAGTAVLVDNYGIPRVRCACGNPLSPPLPQSSPKYTGPTWPGFSPSELTVIEQAARLASLVLVDIHTQIPFSRPVGTHGQADKPVAAGGPAVTTTPPKTKPATTTPPKPSSPSAPVDVTRQGAVKASSEYPGGEFPVSNATDGDTATSWFSAGVAADANTATFTWTAPRGVRIVAVRIIGNENSATPAYRHNEGFQEAEVRILNSAGTVVFDQAHIPGPGNTAPDVVIRPNVVGSVIQMLFTGHEDPACGGFSELQVFS